MGDNFMHFIRIQLLNLLCPSNYQEILYRSDKSWGYLVFVKLTVLEGCLPFWLEGHYDEADEDVDHEEGNDDDVVEVVVVKVVVVEVVVVKVVVVEVVVVKVVSVEMVVVRVMVEVWIGDVASPPASPIISTESVEAATRPMTAILLQVIEYNRIHSNECVSFVTNLCGFDISQFLKILSLTGWLYTVSFFFDESRNTNEHSFTI